MFNKHDTKLCCFSAVVACYIKYPQLTNGKFFLTRKPEKTFDINPKFLGYFGRLVISKTVRYL